MTSVAFKPKRGRPSIKQVQAIDSAIIATARAMFLNNGFDSFSMAVLASELGISKGTLYTRHASKEALLQAVIKDTVEGWSTTSARNNHLLPDDIGGRLRQHLRTIGLKTAEPEVRAFYQLWMSVRDRDPEISRIFHDVGFMHGVQVIANDMIAASIRDDVPLRDPTGTATLLLSALTGWYMQETNVRTVDLEEIEACADRIVELFMLARPGW